MEQYIINWLLAGFGGLIGFFLKSIWQAVKDLQEADKEITRTVAQIELFVAGAYVRKEDFVNSVNGLFAKLDRIEDKLDKKVDK